MYILFAIPKLTPTHGSKMIKFQTVIALLSSCPTSFFFGMISPTVGTHLLVAAGPGSTRCMGRVVVCCCSALPRG